jgi:hypothetical protein
MAELLGYPPYPPTDPQPQPARTYKEILKRLKDVIAVAEETPEHAEAV